MTQRDAILQDQPQATRRQRNQRQENRPPFGLNREIYANPDRKSSG